MQGKKCVSRQNERVTNDFTSCNKACYVSVCLVAEFLFFFHVSDMIRCEYVTICKGSTEIVQKCK